MEITKCRCSFLTLLFLSNLQWKFQCITTLFCPFLFVTSVLKLRFLHSQLLRLMPPQMHVCDIHTTEEYIVNRCNASSKKYRTCTLDIFISITNFPNFSGNNKMLLNYLHIIFWRYDTQFLLSYAGSLSTSIDSQHLLCRAEIKTMVNYLFYKEIILTCTIMTKQSRRATLPG